jgi:hypothetical protein
MIKDTQGTGGTHEPPPPVDETEPLFARTVRSVLLPMASFYGRNTCPPKRGEATGDLTDEERQVLCEAASKATAELPQLLRAWRTTGDLGSVKVERGVDGKFPDPSLAAVGEILAAFGVVGRDTDSLAERRELEYARMEVELERERLSAERERYAFLREALRSGRADLVDAGPVEVKSDTLTVLRARRTAAYTRGKSTPAPTAPPPAAAPAQPTAATQRQLRVLARSSAPPTMQTQSQMIVMAPETPAPDTSPAESSGLAMETKGFRGRFMDCMKGAVCDLLLCMLDLFCRDGHFDWTAFSGPQAKVTFAGLLQCLGDFLCRLLKCLVDALCPPAAAACLETESDCHFAVEGAF